MAMPKHRFARSTLERFRRRLLARQRELFDETEGAERDLRVIEETRESEVEERSQEEAMASLLSLLEQRQQAELRDIHDALARIRENTFGICTACGIKIRRERLDALPVAQLCGRCEQAAEADRRREQEAPRLPTPSEQRALPAEFRGLESNEIATLVRERLHDEVGDAVAGLRLSVEDAAVTLSGELASDELRRVVIQVVEDEMGLDVADRVRIVGTADRAEPSRWSPQDSELEADTAHETAAATPDSSEDALQAEEEGVPYTPPARPVPGEE